MQPSEELSLVTGACGFVGSTLVDLLLTQGLRVRATDLPYANLVYLPSNDQLEFIAADLTDPQDIKNIVQGVTHIYHPAGIFRFNAPKKLLNKVNVQGTTNLINAALSEPIIHFVNWSTAMVYGTLKHLPADETHPISPEEPYSQSKWLQEQMTLSFYEENDFPISIIRPTAIYGPRSMYGTALAIRAFAEGRIFGIPGNGQTIQHHVHVVDVCRAANFIANNKQTIGRIYNIADNNPLSLIQTLECLAGFTTKKVPKMHIPRRLVLFYGALDRLYNTIREGESLFEKAALNLLFSDHIFDNTRLKKIGFEYSYPSFKQGIQETLLWYKTQGIIKF